MTEESVVLSTPNGFAPADLPRRQAFADGDGYLGGGLRHVAVVVDHRLGLAGFERQVAEGRGARLLS